MSFRLTPNAKLLKPSQYQAVFEHGTTSKSKYWQIIARQVSENNSRLGLAISKKVKPLAVDRNRIKRIARETFRVKKSSLNHWEFVVMARPAHRVSNATLAVDLQRLFSQATHC